MSVQDELFTEEGTDGAFAVELDIFSGPFDVLLNLIARKRLDVTEVALAEVTDEFLAFIAAQDEQDLSQMSEFLVVGATLLDLKAARLLPHEEEDDEDLELLEARDLLFAKLLQYRAFKRVAADIAARLSTQALAEPRDVPLEEYYGSLMPEVELRITVDDLARLAAAAMSRKPAEVGFDHLHDPLVPVDTQIEVLRERMVIGDRQSFSRLCRDAMNVPTVVSRFMAVLEMMRNGELKVEQDGALQPLLLTRIGPPKRRSQVAEATSVNDDVEAGPPTSGEEEDENDD